MENLAYAVMQGVSLTVLYIFLIVLSKFINDWLTPYKLDEQLVHKDNVALAISLSGQFFAVTAIFIGALIGSSQGILMDLTVVGGYSLLGIVLLNLARIINDKVILYKFSNVKEIIEDRNNGTGAVQFGSYVASGLIIAGSIHGEGGGILTLLAFYALGQVALIAFTWVYNLITPFDVHAEIEKDNVAAGVAFAGALIGIGIILMQGASGNFVSWQYNLSIFGMDAVLIILLLPVVRFIFDKIIIRKSDLNHEIKNDRNVGAAFLEAAMMISFSIVLYYTLG